MRLLRSGSILARFSLPSKGLHCLPDLPYDYNALEPVIDAETMLIHHKKHHQTYVNNLNRCLAQMASETNMDRFLSLERELRFNAGGHANHSMFWRNLIEPRSFVEPSEKMKRLFNQHFGGMDQMVSLLQKRGMQVQGSGWVWLALDPISKALRITTTVNQDPPSLQGVVQVLGIDLWEHAYYLKYRNKREKYLDSVMRIINWKNVETNYEQI